MDTTHYANAPMNNELPNESTHRPGKPDDTHRNVKQDKTAQATSQDSFADSVLTAVNAMPAPTWHRIQANDATITIPFGLTAVSDYRLEGEGIVYSTPDDFDNALSTLQKSLDKDFANKSDSRAVVQALDPQTAPDNLDVPALSQYQRAAVKEELANSVAGAFDAGATNAAYRFIQELSPDPLVICGNCDASSNALVTLVAEEGCANGLCLDVIAEPYAKLTVRVLLDSPATKKAFLGLGLRVFAGVGSHVSLTTYQTAQDGCVAVDTQGVVADAAATVEINHRVLGAGHAFTGLYTDLRGKESSLTTTLHYVGNASEERDFNYTTKHCGVDTQSAFDAHGVLSGSSKKVWRGTIDLVHGCKGAIGNERETVLLADQGVDNKTIPVILCDEDDVQGNHGATIGHIRPEQRLYLACRGLSDAEIEQLFNVATFEEAYLSDPSDTVKDAIVRLAQSKGIPAHELFADEGDE